VYSQPFSVRPHNAHYEGEYSDAELAWRRVCAIDKARNLKTLLGARPVASVLEVGCGTGAVLAAVARAGVGTRHVGVDMADPTVHLDDEARTLDIQPYDGARLPFADASFDLVYCSHVIEHVPDPRGLLAEIRRVARSVIYLEVPCELHVRATRDSLQRTLDIGHINAYTPESFSLLVQTSQLELLDSQLFDHSVEVHAFGGSRLKGQVKKAIRSTLLAFSPQWAGRTFTYHFGVLCRPA
jgi:SAM-dependent methyltransferase